MKEDSPGQIALIRRVAAGDQTAFAELFDTCGPLVLGVLRRILGNPSEAEEVLQETFLQVWHRAGDYRPERGSPRGWILMLARSRALDQVRSRRARERREEEASAERQRGSGGSIDPAGSERLEGAERAQQVGSALTTLPPEQRHPIELAFFGGLTHTQIADRLGMPLGTVKSRILLGMKKLRRELRAPA